MRTIDVRDITRKFHDAQQRYFEFFEKSKLVMPTYKIALTFIFQTKYSRVTKAPLIFLVLHTLIFKILFSLSNASITVTDMSRGQQWIVNNLHHQGNVIMPASLR